MKFIFLLLGSFLIVGCSRVSLDPPKPEITEIAPSRVYNTDERYENKEDIDANWNYPQEDETNPRAGRYTDRRYNTCVSEYMFYYEREDENGQYQYCYTDSVRFNSMGGMMGGGYYDDRYMYNGSLSSFDAKPGKYRFRMSTTNNDENKKAYSNYRYFNVAGDEPAVNSEQSKKWN